MKNKILKKASVSAISFVATLMLAVTVNADQSGSFNTEIEDAGARQDIIDRAASQQPTSVVETGGGINGDTSLTDTASGVTAVVNKGAQQAKQEAQAEINSLKAKVADLEDQLAGTGAPQEDEITEQSFTGYMSESSWGCITQAKGGGCWEEGNITYYYSCKQTDVYMNGTYIRSDIKKTSAGSKYNQFSGPRCTGTKQT